jgi:hypothetical protein
MPLDVFSYQDFLSNYGISYVVLRDPEAVARFRNDSLFSLVFANEEVSIFSVNKITQ